MRRAIVVFALGVVGLGVAWGLGAWLVESALDALGWDAIARVEVEGTVRLEPAQVRVWAEIPKRTGLWALAPEPIVARLERRAWINTVFVRKRFPNTLVIEVVERIPTAVAQTERGAVLIDAEGAVLEPTRLDTGFPLVVGASLKRPEGLAVAADLLAGLHAVDSTVFRAADVVVDVTAVRDPIVRLPGGSRVRFGEGDYAAKWRRYLAIHVDVVARVPGARLVDVRFHDRAVVTGG
jgi:cell division protein FtsQ